MYGDMFVRNILHEEFPSITRHIPGFHVRFLALRKFFFLLDFLQHIALKQITECMSCRNKYGMHVGVLTGLSNILWILQQGNRKLIKCVVLFKNCFCTSI